MRFDKELYHNATVMFGSERQSLIAMEECSELCQAISKCIRYYNGSGYKKMKNNKYISNLAEEMADVLIMIEQLKDIYGVNEQDIQEWIEKKEGRLYKNFKKEYDTRYYMK